MKSSTHPSRAGRFTPPARIALLLLAALILSFAPRSSALAFQGVSNMVYSTFLGGQGNDCFPRCAVAVDSGGSVYIAGYTASDDFPAQLGASGGPGGEGDIFVAKLNLDGNRLDYAVRLGGSGADYATAIAVDGAGHAYITGYTASDDFPVSAAGAGSRYGGGFSDAFVVKIKPDGSGLAYAAFLGGDGTDRAYGLAVDQNGRVVVTGETQSDDFPVSGGASVCTGGEGDAFVAQLNPQGERLAFSTCLGGSARDEGLAVAADSLGQVYVAGKTSSPDFPVSEGALAETPAGQGDAFVVKLNPATGDLRYATFLGGSSIDRAEAIAVDSAGRATVAGSTISPDFPATPNAFAASPHKGYEAFVARLNADGSGLVYATFLGGSSGDRAYAVAVDGAGRAYVTGATYSQNFPATPAAFDGSYNYGYADSFFVRLNPDGSGLEYATFLGGSEPDYGMAVALDGEGSAYLAGATRSPTYPATVRGADPTHNGDWDGFVTKIAFEKPPHTALISGIIRDPQGSPVPGVVVSAGAEGSTTTDANGVYVLIGLNPGTYTLTPIKSGYAFSPPRRTLNVPTAESLLVFTGVPQGDPPDPFLDLPLDYGHSPAAFVQALQDADSQGWITSWFDHAYPDYGKNRRLTLPDGLPRAGEGFNLKLGCYERRCYDGHDGLDLIYRDFRPGVTNLPAVKVFAAAAGRVAATRTGCTVGNKRCGEGFGNYVVLAHPNGYFTLYGHLAKVQVKANAAVAQGDAIGFMGNTGNSSGFHLHFGVYRDGGNGAWDGFEAEQPVDPFGWQGSQADPWVVDRQGPVSAYLWRYPLAQQKSFVGSRGTALSDAAGAVEATIPAGAFEGRTRLELLLSAVPDAPPGQRSAGRAFWLRLLEWLPKTGDAPVAADPSAALARPISLNVAFSEADARHLNLAELRLHRWDETSRQWRPLPTTVNPRQHLAAAQSGSLGRFSLQAPLACPADTVEPDDNYFSARAIEGDEPLARLFDIPGDEDWFYFDALEGGRYTVQTTGLGTTVDTRIELYDMADGSLLASDDNGGPGTASRLTWVAPASETYFIRVAPSGNSAVGCRAAYRLSLSSALYRQFLPLIVK